VITLLLACGTMNAARPLEPGQHAVGATFGGAVVDAGFVTTPLPNLVVEGRSGLTTFHDRPFELSYGANLTGIAFGLAGVHVGGAWLAMDQDGWKPAVALSERTHLYTNVFDTTKTDKQLMTMLQFEVLASWDSDRALLYVGLADYLQPSNPMLTLSPILGTEVHLGERWGVQLEARHLAITQNKDPLGTVNWVTWGPGALSLTLGVNRTIGAAK
jgi:hypothetical protein